jgi:hypothetical protein
MCLPSPPLSMRLSHLPTTHLPWLLWKVLEASSRRHRWELGRRRLLQQQHQCPKQLVIQWLGQPKA